MTTVHNIKSGARRVSDMVMDGFRRVRGTMSSEEGNLAVHLRGNEPLYEALTGLIRFRIRRRENLPVPSDPLECKSVLERNNELRWLLAKLEFMYHSPANQEADGKQGEPPAA